MRFAVAGALVYLIIWVAQADARTWYIEADGTGDAPTIQAGIDSAAVSDTVLVAPGRYTGVGNKNLDFGGKDLVLLSEAGSEVTIIDCEGAGRGMYFHSGESPAGVVQGFTIESGNVETNNGGGMCCEDSSPTIMDCTFSGNSAGTSGGGMYCEGSSPTVTDCTFSENSAGSLGGGMYCSYSSSPTVTRCTFSGNSATSGGGGMYCVYDSSPTVTDCTFSGNSTTAYLASYGGGMRTSYDSFPTVRNCTFSGNSAGGSGGGMACTSSAPTVTNCTFSGNSAGYSGAGVYCHAYSSPALENTIIAFSTQGAAVYCTSLGSATLTCCDVYGNAGGDWVGCIADQYGVNGNISEDPLFCGEANYPGDPYRLDIASPCAVHNSRCGQLIGARPAGCSEGVSTERTTWGRVKAMYR